CLGEALPPLTLRLGCTLEHQTTGSHSRATFATVGGLPSSHLWRLLAGESSPVRNSGEHPRLSNKGAPIPVPLRSHRLQLQTIGRNFSKSTTGTNTMTPIRNPAVMLRANRPRDASECGNCQFKSGAKSGGKVGGGCGVGRGLNGCSSLAATGRGGAATEDWGL